MVQVKVHFKKFLRAILCIKLETVNMSMAFLNRNVNERFSGDEKKRNEIL